MKPWNITIDEKPYQIKMKGASLIINETEQRKLKQLLSHKEGMFKVYDVPLGSKTAKLYVNSWVGGVTLAMDGVDCATGAPYTVPILPKWAYLFMILHCFYFTGGVIGALFAIAGMSMTISISCCSRFSLLTRIFLNIAVVVMFFLMLLGIALSISS